jgi:hypothetical protein
MELPEGEVITAGGDLAPVRGGIVPSVERMAGAVVERERSRDVIAVGGPRMAVCGHPITRGIWRLGRGVVGAAVAPCGASGPTGDL